MTKELYFSDDAKIETKLKQERKKLHKTKNKFEVKVNEIVQNQQTADRAYQNKMLQKKLFTLTPY